MTITTGRSGETFSLGSGGIPTDCFEKQAAGSAYHAEYKATQAAMPAEYRNNDALIDKAIQQYFFPEGKARTPIKGTVQQTQARMDAVNKVVAEHESAETVKLNTQQATASALPASASILNSLGMSPAAVEAMAAAPGASVAASPVGDVLLRGVARASADPLGKAAMAAGMLGTALYYEVRYGGDNAKPDAMTAPSGDTTATPNIGMTPADRQAALPGTSIADPATEPLVTPPFVEKPQIESLPMPDRPTVGNIGFGEGATLPVGPDILIGKASEPARVLEAAGISRPQGMFRPHAHHVVYEVGIGATQQSLVKEGQAILAKYGIDPVTGVENLVWAPNVAGQHTVENLQAVVEALKEADAAGASKADIMEVLRDHGKLAAERMPK